MVSIRSWVEYIGETSGYDYIEAAGRIPGAVYGYAGSDPWHMEDYRNVDNTMVNFEYMAKRWADQDIYLNMTMLSIVVQDGVQLKLGSTHIQWIGTMFLSTMVAGKSGVKQKGTRLKKGNRRAINNELIAEHRDRSSENGK